MKIRYFDTFTGIGGFTKGIEQAYENIHNRHEAERASEVLRGMVPNASGEHVQGTPTCIGYSEINKYASQIYAKHYPDHINFGDITKIDADALPDFDLLVGGFPCQAFSIAGKRRGFEDTRGTLFFDLARILRAKRPRYFVFENVKGLLSHDSGSTYKTIIATLSELGYDVEWKVLNSKNHGVPQNRERVYIVGRIGGVGGRKVFPLGEDDGEAVELSGQHSNTLTTRYYGGQANGTYVGEGKLDAQEIVQLNKPKHSNDRVYDSSGLEPTLNTMQGGNRQPFVKIPEATKQGYAEAQIGDSINLSVPNSSTRRGRVGKEVAQTLDTQMQQHTLSKDMRIRRLTPTECCRLQGFPDGWTKYGINEKGETVEISNSQRYKVLGNAVTVNVVEDVMSKLLYNA